MDHKWADVIDERWCFGCDQHQRRASKDDPWLPAADEECPRSSPLAKFHDASVNAGLRGRRRHEQIPSVARDAWRLALDRMLSELGPWKVPPRWQPTAEDIRNGAADAENAISEALARGDSSVEIR